MTPPRLSGIIEKRDSQPLLNILDLMGGWPVTMERWNESVGKAGARQLHPGLLVAEPLQAPAAAGAPAQPLRSPPLPAHGPGYFLGPLEGSGSLESLWPSVPQRPCHHKPGRSFRRLVPTGSGTQSPTRAWLGPQEPSRDPARGADPPGPRWELEQQLALMNAQFNRRVLIDLFIWNDDQNSSRHIIYVRVARGAGSRRRPGKAGALVPGWGALRAVGSRQGLALGSG